MVVFKKYFSYFSVGFNYHHFLWEVFFSALLLGPGGGAIIYRLHCIVRGLCRKWHPWLVLRIHCVLRATVAFNVATPTGVYYKPVV